MQLVKPIGTQHAAEEMEYRAKMDFPKELISIINESLCGDLYRMTAGGPRQKSGSSRMKVRPVLVKDRLLFQIEDQIGAQVFHVNETADAAAERITLAVWNQFRRLDIETKQYQAVVMISKSKKVTVKKKKTDQQQEPTNIQPVLTHNRVKKYILEEGRAVPFLVDLGIQTAEGQTVRNKYDKFRQINRYLEFIADILPILPKDRCVHIIDFGCGKSYLTFAMYYYLHELNGLDIRVTGLDLKKEVIENCTRLALRYGYDGLVFEHGDIADYTGTDHVDMVVSLHACDTATDYALYKAMCWNAGVILAVPCCHHEVNRQIRSDILQPAFQYGIIRERMAALFTDALRAQLLTQAGYETQLLEFIDMEHTPKNILIRAVKKGHTQAGAAAGEPAADMAAFLHVNTTLQKLMGERGDSQQSEMDDL